MKTRLVNGVAGQAGAYLVRLLLANGYTVHGIRRRSSLFNTQRVDGIDSDPHDVGPRCHLRYGGLSDATNLVRTVEETQLDEIYTLAMQSRVQVSFETPWNTTNSSHDH